MNPYRFENQNREIVLSRYNMPTPWMNYLSNGTLHAMISQAGGGVAWYKSPQIWRINHYRFFHLPTDRSGFYTYIKDGDSVWCPTNEPCACKPEKWEAAHGMGYTRFTAERDGLHAEATYLVSPLKNVMLWHLELRSDRDRNVTIYPYVELGMMEFMRELQWQCYNKHQLSVYEKDGVLIYRYGVENQPKPDETPLVYFASDVPAAGFDCDRDEFVGSYRSEEAPIGLEHEHLKNSTLFGGDPCFALELPLTLRAGETKSVNIYLGTEMTEDEAVIAMVDSNLQRESILPSERAFAYSMRLDAMRRQGERTDLTCAQNAHKLKGRKSRDVLAEELGVSKDKVRRYIRLTHLVPGILDLVDEGRMRMLPAVEVSYLSRREQETLLDAMRENACTPSHSQALKMKRFSQEGELGEALIRSIMEEEKPNQVESFRIPKRSIARFFRPSASREEVEARVVRALELLEQAERKRAAWGKGGNPWAM